MAGGAVFSFRECPLSYVQGRGGGVLLLRSCKGVVASRCKRGGSQGTIVAYPFNDLVLLQEFGAEVAAVVEIA